MSYRNAVDVAIERGRPLELQRLLSAKPDWADAFVEFEVSVLLQCVEYHRPECARVLIEGRGVNFQRWTLSYKGLLCKASNHIFAYQDDDHEFFGDCILLMDLLMHYEPDFWDEAAGSSVMQTNASYVAQELRSHVLYQGTSAYSEREGILSLLEGRYWQEYGNRNPFLEASMSQEMMELLVAGAANNERGHTDLTKLRSIKPSLRRPVMELLHQRTAERRSLGELHVAVSNNKAHGAIVLVSGLEKAIFPILADFLGVRGRPLHNARNALSVFEDLATGEYEREYGVGDW